MSACSVKFASTEETVCMEEVKHSIIKEHYINEHEMIMLILESKKGVPGKIERINMIHEKINE